MVNTPPIVTREHITASYGKPVTVYTCNFANPGWSWRIEEETGYENDQRVTTFMLFRVSPIGQGIHVATFREEKDAEDIAAILAMTRQIYS